MTSEADGRIKFSECNHDEALHRSMTNRHDDEIFWDAIHHPTLEPRQAVKFLCAADAAQLERVMALVDSHQKLEQRDSGSSILDRAGDVFDALSDRKQLVAGDSIGQYLIVRKLGEGGMGVVYHARLAAKNPQDVALKLLKPGLDSQRVLARFAFERQVLEQMDHAGITRIFDAGIQPNGRPYFAMELLENSTNITAFCDSETRAIRERLQLLVEVCGIVQHAHQKGVIHRDLKPSNILICATEAGAVSKVIDFGIAKAIEGDLRDDGELTIVGERMGTPAYMSPEQAKHSAIGVDVRTDVFSLGAVLYELLTGATPRQQLVPGDLGQASDTIWERPIAPPSERIETAVDLSSISTARNCSPEELRDQLKGELDWIALKALAPDRSQRYQSVADLQRDLERFMRGEPVEAAGPGSFYRLRKFIGRNRIATTTAAAILLTVVATSIVSTSYALRAKQAETDATNRLGEVLQIQAELTKQRDLASAAEKRSQSLLRAFQIQVVVERAFLKFTSSLLNESSSPDDFSSIANLEQDSLNFLLQPDSRLIVKGNWDWTSERIWQPVELLKASTRLTSREVAEFSGIASSPPRQKKDKPPEANAALNAAASNIVDVHPNESPSAELQTTNAVSQRLRFETSLLDELSRELTADDPFLAEVNDNCGLNWMDQERYEQAEECLRESVRIWGLMDHRVANRVQSELFLVQCLADQSKLSEARELLNSAISRLETLDQATAEHKGLRELADKILQQFPSY